MSEKFILTVSDQDETNQAEMTVLDTSHEVERLVETLLEAGFDRERIRVFTGTEAEFVTTYRPVVALMDDAARQAPEPDHSVGHSGNGADGRETEIPSAFRKEAEDVRDEAGLALSKAHADNGHSRGRGRFSSLFRSACDDSYVFSACEEVA